MQAAQVLGGYSLGGADLLRRAMGKKKAEEMAQAPRRSSATARPRRASRRRCRRGLRPDGEVRRLRLQQEPCRGVFAAGLSHGLDQGALHGRVLRRQHDGRGRRHRQAEGAAERRRSLRRQLRAARHQPRRAPLRAGRPTARCATAWARSRAPGRARSRPSSRARGTAAAGRSAACSTSAPASTASASTSASSRRWSRPAPSTRCTPTAPRVLASVGLAFDWAETQAAHADQGGLFDFGADAPRRGEHAGAGAGRAPSRGA